MAYRYQPSRIVTELVSHSQRPGSQPGSEVISLASGDPDFKTPAHIGRALAAAIAAGYTHYAEHQGDPELRAVIAASVSRVAGRSYRVADVVITHGGSGGLATAILATVDAGDRVVIPEPTYSLYADLVRVAGGTPVFVPPASGFRPDMNRIAAALPGARMIILCHPCNPTGTVYTAGELEALAGLATKEDVLVLADEAYDHIIYNGVTFTSTLQVPALAERLIYCQTFSKTYAMTGWRLGYLVTPPEIASAATRVHRTFTGPLNAALQRAGMAALATPPEVIEEMRREYQARRELVLAQLSDIPGVECCPPDGAFYAFVRYPQHVSALEMVRMAVERGVAVRPGSEFGPSGEGHIRIAFSTERGALRDGMRRLRGLLAGP